jgi:hypothetical protein
MRIAMLSSLLITVAVLARPVSNNFLGLARRGRGRRSTGLVERKDPVAADKQKRKRA